MIKSNGWETLSVPDTLRASELKDAKFYTKKTGNELLQVIIGHEERNEKNKKLWHMSISLQNRYPTWDEIKSARYELLPIGLTFMMLLPPPNEYVNVHPNCFHLWEYSEK